MTSLQIRNVPENSHQILRDRAAAEGKSLQEYLLSMILRQTSQLTPAEVFDEIDKSLMRFGTVDTTSEEIIEELQRGRSAR